MTTQQQFPISPDSKVVVSETAEEVHVPDKETLDPVLIGWLVSRLFQGERVQRHSFVPVKDNPDRSKEYSLGPTTTAFEFVDHTDALRPLFKNGYTIKDIVQGRGGLHLYTVLEPKDPVTIADPINWDHELWGIDPKADSNLTESVVVTTSVRPGKGLTFKRGVYRMVCSNGMVAEILGFGNSRQNHTNWDPNRMLHELNFDNGGPTYNSDSVMGPYVGNAQGTKAFRDLIRRFEADEVSNRSNPEGVPFYIADQINPLLRMPKWWRELFIGQLDAMLKAKVKKVHVLDVLNALTSPVNLERRENPDRAVLRPLSRMPSLIKSVSQFIGVLSL